MDSKTKVTLHGGGWDGDEADVDLSECYPPSGRSLTRSTDPIVFMARAIDTPDGAVIVSEWYSIDEDHHGWLCHCHVAHIKDKCGEGMSWIKGQYLPGDSFMVKSE